MPLGKTTDVGPEGQQSPETSRDTHEDDGEPESFKDKLKMRGLRKKLKETHLYDVKVKAIHMKHQVGKFENLFNSNHRHDEEHEQKTDRKRTGIAEGHRFQSFAPEREGNRIKWYIDGRDYFHAVSVALERAKETIYIEDWWLSPELFLRRPAAPNQKWRLDQTLKRAAERGVKIYVIVYKEVAQALTCNSQHTKHALAALCPEGSPGHGNIVCMRHPDHNFLENQGDMTFYWAHHEKFIVIDYDLAFIGGLDLCFGRWDNTVHALADAHPSGVENEIWPGQDFNNNRIMDFQTVDDWKTNELSKAEYGRMPWHDVAMGVIGPSVYDIAEHFVLRWNFTKRDKYKRDERYDWLTITHRTGEDEDLIGVQRPKHPVGEYIHHPLSPLEHKTGNPNQARSGHANLGTQTNSAVDQAAGAQQPQPGSVSDSDDDFHDAHESLDRHGYTTDQHRVHRKFHPVEDAWNEHRPHLHKDKTLPQLPKEAQSSQPSEDAVGSKQEHGKVTGNDPKNEGLVASSGGVAEKSKAYSSNVLGKEGEGERVGQGTVHAQLVRSSADWSSGILTESSIQNAYCEIIRAAKHYVYIENQFFITATGDKQAPVHNLIGAAIVDAVVAAAKENRKFRVIIVIPAIPGFAGDLRDDAAMGTRAIMDYQYKSINRGEHSIFGRIKAQNVDPTKHIFLFNLRSYDRINKTPAMKEQEEKSGVKYHEVQRAHAEDVMGEGVHGTKGGDASDEDVGDGQRESDVGREKEQFKGKRRQFEDQRNEAGLGGGEDNGKGVISEDSITRDAMLNQKKPSEENWAGHQPGKPKNEEEEKLQESEKENFVQEELYIHGKILIVDDRIVICGSSNINDRSQLGSHDSELSIVMEDTFPLPSKMDGKEYMAGHHAATLRRMLWREHLGLLPAQPWEADDDINAMPPSDGESYWHEGDEWDKFVADPLSDELWDMWTSRATTNTGVFRHLFHADPDDNIKTFDDYQNFLPKGDRKAGHLYDPFQPVDVVRQELDKIKGHLVWFPLEFLCNEKMAETGLQVNSYTESIYT